MLRVFTNSGLIIWTIIFVVIIFTQQTNIPNLVNSSSLNIHYATGLISMFLFPIQKILVALDLNYLIVHIILGSIIIINTTITSVCGLIYISLYGTVGSNFMDVSFVIYGLLMLMTSLITLLVSTKIIFYPTKILKQQHYVLTNLLGALIYSSLFYRVLYNWAKLFNYVIPNSTNSEDLYLRPLDQTFQLMFFLLPLTTILSGSLLKVNKQQLLVNVLRGLLIVMMIITLVISF